LLSKFPSIDGFFNWWSWCVWSEMGVCKAESITNRPADTNTNLTTDTDLAYQRQLSRLERDRTLCVCVYHKLFVSQMKLTMYLDPQLSLRGSSRSSVEVRTGSNWVTHWNYRWEQAVQQVVPDIVEIVTWNDYAESHYIGDINPKVGLGTIALCNGFVHSRGASSHSTISSTSKLGMLRLLRYSTLSPYTHCSVTEHSWAERSSCLLVSITP
jgi:glucan endo-1,3-alpha-glucosidase